MPASTRSRPTPRFSPPARGRSSPAISTTCAPHGLDDVDLVDLNNIVAYYAYINRVANGLGLFSEIPEAHARGAVPK